MGNQNLFHKNTAPLPLMFCSKQTSNWHKLAFLVKWTSLGDKNELEIFFIYLFIYCRHEDSILLIMTFNSGTEFFRVGLSRHQGAMVWMPLVIRDIPWHTKGWLQGALQAVQAAIGLKCCLPSTAWSFSPAVLGGAGALEIGVGAISSCTCSHQLPEPWCTWDAGPLPLFTVLSFLSTWVSVCSTEALTRTISL